jgi:hypothetical protein
MPVWQSHLTGDFLELVIAVVNFRLGSLNVPVDQRSEFVSVPVFSRSPPPTRSLAWELRSAVSVERCWKDMFPSRAALRAWRLLSRVRRHATFRRSPSLDTMPRSSLPPNSETRISPERIGDTCTVFGSKANSSSNRFAASPKSFALGSHYRCKADRKRKNVAAL